MTLPYLDANNFDMSKAYELFDSEGFIIVRNALSEPVLTQIQRDLEPHFQDRPRSHGLFWGKNTTRIEAILTKSVSSQDPVTSDIALSLAEHALGKNCDHVQLHLTQGIRIHPGERAQVLHPDSAMFPMKKEFEFMINAIWALSPFTKENGATQVVPGSHLWEEGRMPEEHEICYAEMEPGDVLFYRASLLHGGGANVTADQCRTGLSVSYSLGWLRQSENMYLTYPPHIASKFSPKLQVLIGYNVHRPNLGWVHGHNPAALLNEENFNGIGAEDFLTDEQNAMLKDYYDGQSLSVNEEATRVTAKAA